MSGNILREKSGRVTTARVGSTLSKGVAISEKVMVYQKRETRQPEKALKKRVTKEALVSRKTNRKRV